MREKTGIITFTGDQFRRKLNAFTIALYLSSQGFNLMVQAFVPAFSTVGLAGIFIICFVLMIIGIRKIQLNAVIYMCPLLFLLYFLITNLLFPGESSVNVIQILTYVILPFLLVQLDFDLKNVIKWTIIIASPTILVGSIVFTHTYSGSLSMGVSYAFLPPVLCAMAYIVCYFKEEKNNIARIIYLILCLIDVYFLFQLLFYGSRGVVVCIFAFAAILIFFRKNKITGELESRNRILFTVLIIILFIILAFGDTIFAWLSSLFSSSEVNFISKSIALSQESERGILNGRGAIYLAALQGILRSPLLGNGIGMFMANTGIVYPHDFLLQLLYDGGLLLFVPVITCMVIYSIRIIKSHKYEEFIGWALLLCISVPGALFSGDVWEKYTLWFFTAYCIMKGIKMTRNVQVKETKQWMQAYNNELDEKQIKS